MHSILKTFRLPEIFVRFLENKAEAEGSSQTEILIKSIPSSSNILAI